MSDSLQCQALHLTSGLENEVILQGQGSMKWCVNLQICQICFGVEEQGWVGTRRYTSGAAAVRYLPAGPAVLDAQPALVLAALPPVSVYSLLSHCM